MIYMWHIHPGCSHVDLQQDTRTTLAANIATARVNFDVTAGTATGWEAHEDCLVQRRTQG